MDGETARVSVERVVRAVIPEDHEDPQSPVGASDQDCMAVSVCLAFVRLYASFGLVGFLDCEPGPWVGRTFLLQFCGLEALNCSVTGVSPSFTVELFYTRSPDDFLMQEAAKQDTRRRGGGVLSANHAVLGPMRTELL